MSEKRLLREGGSSCIIIIMIFIKKRVKSSVRGDEDIILLSAARAQHRHKKNITPRRTSETLENASLYVRRLVYLIYQVSPVNGKVVKGLLDRHKTHHRYVYRGTPCRCIYIIVYPVHLLYYYYYNIIYTCAPDRFPMRRRRDYVTFTT